jgi:hypothetical protein
MLNPGLIVALSRRYQNVSGQREALKATFVSSKLLKELMKEEDDSP